MHEDICLNEPHYFATYVKNKRRVADLKSQAKHFLFDSVKNLACVPFFKDFEALAAKLITFENVKLELYYMHFLATDIFKPLLQMMHKAQSIIIILHNHVIFYLWYRILNSYSMA